MQIRIRSTGAVVYEGEFRSMHASTSFPAQLTEEIINALGGDVVFEGPQATGGDHYQYSIYSGVEEIDGKWYTKYVLGPTFTDTQDMEGNVTTAADNEAAYKASKDEAQAKAVRDDRAALVRRQRSTDDGDALHAVLPHRSGGRNRLRRLGGPHHEVGKETDREDLQ